MKPKPKTRPKRGRPLSGKKAFLVRMPPSAYEVIHHIAHGNGLHMGDWLALLHALDYRPAGIGDNDSILALQYERKRFVILATEASRLLEMLFECADSDPQIIDDVSVPRAMSALEANRKKLMAFLKRECPERYQHPCFVDAQR
jgi:hypothetical protein